MPSISATQLPDLAVNTGLKVIADTYQPDALYFPRFCEVIADTAVSHGPWGDKSTTIVHGATPRERFPGQEHAHDTAGQGYEPQGRLRFYSVAMSIADEHLEAVDADRKVVALLSDFTRQAAINAAAAKDLLVANLLNKGPLTAGHADTFDGSFIEHADPYPTVIYDGLPFFDTAHTIKFGSTTYSNHTAALALSATNLDTVYTTMTTTNAIDEAGRRIMQTPNVLIIPPGLRTTAAEILESTGKVDGSTNNINAQRGLVEALIHPLLSDSDSWFLGVRGQGIRVMDSGAPRMKVWREEGKNTTHCAVEYRFGAYVRNWRPWYACNIAAS